MSAPPLRIVVWSTGGIGSIAIKAIRGRPDLELVGVWIHSADKVGRDVGELSGGSPLGLAATSDAEELIALPPDCVVYAAAVLNATPPRSRTTSGCSRLASTSSRPPRRDWCSLRYT